ncbi:thiol reductant ABC exporter subunit CydC [Saccharopolyspora sp. NPDC050389]|uniref:thiol reductant ABC exporter subunit CydC n=1 Tax=Saccharopolyspora sp. NPDC050389 TaxID=3155516 RepID=UPI0033D6A3DE
MLRLFRAPRLLAAVACGMTAELSAVGLMALAAWLITRAAEQPALSALSLAIVGVRACALARGTFRYLERLAGHDAALRVVAELRPKVFRARLGRPALRDGDALSRLIADVDSVQELLLRCLSPAVIAFVVGVASALVCVVLAPAAGLVLVVGLLVAGVVLPLVAVPMSSRNLAAASEDRALLAVAGADLVDGARELAAFDATAEATARAEGHTARIARRERAAARAAGFLTAAGIAIQGLTAVGATWLVLLDGRQQITAAVVGFLALAAFEPALPLTEAARKFAEHRPALRRVAELVTTGPKPDPRANAERLALHDVSVHYAAPALRGIDLVIEPGRTVAVVGASGAGKSTMLGVMAGLVEPSTGRVERPETRAVTQDAHVFDTTIRENLRLAAPDATGTQLERAAAQAGLLGWIRSLPAGFDTLVGESGQGISGGQRQRLLLARALLADPPVLLLDEPGESLETGLADELLTGVLRARSGRTTVVVTHRLACVPEFDEVLVLDRGRIVQRGPHCELVAAPGPYRDLWEAELLVDAR